MLNLSRRSIYQFKALLSLFLFVMSDFNEAQDRHIDDNFPTESFATVNFLSSDTYILIVSYSMRADGRGRLSTLRKVVLIYYSYV